MITQYFWPETFRINELCEMFVEHGHEVTILTGVPNYPSGEVFPEFRRSPASFDRFEGSPVVRVPMSSRGTSRAQLVLNYVTFAISAAIIGAWRLRGRRFDVIFVYEPSPITVGVPGMVLRRLKGIPSCLWVLDLWPDTPHALGMLPHPALYRLTQWGVRRIYRSTDLLLVQSPGFVEPVRQLAPPGRRVEYFQKPQRGHADTSASSASITGRSCAAQSTGGRYHAVRESRATWQARFGLLRDRDDLGLAEFRLPHCSS